MLWVVQVGYVEIYNEEVRDLLHSPSSATPTSSSAAAGGGGRGGMVGARPSSITIREDAKGRIIMAGERLAGRRGLACR